MPTDFWLRQPQAYIIEALEEGFTKFTWHVAALIKSKVEVLSWLRSASMGYSADIRMMLIDYTGASEYSIFSSYEKPLAVYPTWAADEPWDQLIWLIENPVGADKEFCNDKNIQPDMRPVAGQKHRVVIHRIGPAGDAQYNLLIQLRELQIQYPECDLFISGSNQFSTLFGYGFQSVDWMPVNVMATGALTPKIILPSGKQIKSGAQFDVRYKDWFELVGMSQMHLITLRDYLKYNLRSVNWASRNWESVVPFARSFHSKKVFMPSEFTKLSDSSFIMPSARRTAMRNLGIQASELDRFICDTCMLQNACTLYREGSVCTLKGSDAVSLAKNFGTRNVELIITGLGKILERQVERLEDAQALEQVSGEMDPHLNAQYNAVFANGVKLAKLLDPSREGGPSVAVNIGVAAGGHAQIIAASDPKQIVANVVAALESMGIAREQITSKMIKGYLESAAVNGVQPALQAAKVINGQASE